MLRVYIGDTNLGAGATAARSIHYRLIDQVTSKRYGGTQTVDVTAPGVAPQQGTASAAINVWVPPAAAAAGRTHSFEVEVNADQTEQECAGCYPNGNRATINGISYEPGGNIVLAPVPILEIGPKDRIIRPSEAALKDAVREGTAELPIRDTGVTIARSPGDLLVRQSDLTADGGCSRLMAALLELRTTPGVAGPLEDFGATRWVGYGPSPDFPGEDGTVCVGRADQTSGRNLVLLGPARDLFAHTLGLTHVIGHTSSRNLSPKGAIRLPYSPGIGGVGYSPGAIPGITEVFKEESTGDLMSYDDVMWTSPKTWLTMFEKIRRESPAADVARSQTTPAVRRLVTGVVLANKAIIYDSPVTEANKPVVSGPAAARVLAQDQHGHTVAQTVVHGTPYAEKGESQPALPFVVALPDGADVASLEVLPIRHGRPLARLNRSKHAPTARLLRLPRRASAAKLLTVRWRARDRDRRDKLSVLLIARRGNGKWRTIVIGPATGSTAVNAKTIGRGKTLTLQLRVSDGLNTTVLNPRAVIVH